jgi:hypothetical protein
MLSRRREPAIGVFLSSFVPGPSLGAAGRSRRYPLSHHSSLTHRRASLRPQAYLPLLKALGGAPGQATSLGNRDLINECRPGLGIASTLIGIVMINGDGDDEILRAVESAARAWDQLLARREPTRCPEDAPLQRS